MVATQSSVCLQDEMRNLKGPSCGMSEFALIPMCPRCLLPCGRTMNPSLRYPRGGPLVKGAQRWCHRLLVRAWKWTHANGHLGQLFFISSAWFWTRVLTQGYLLHIYLQGLYDFIRLRRRLWGHPGQEHNGHSCSPAARILGMLPGVNFVRPGRLMKKLKGED